MPRLSIIFCTSELFVYGLFMSRRKIGASLATALRMTSPRISSRHEICPFNRGMAKYTSSSRRTCPTGTGIFSQQKGSARPLNIRILQRIDSQPEERRIYTSQ
jgi:hypothetical protein